MKRFVSILAAVIMILGLAVPSLSMAASAPKTPSISKLEVQNYTSIKVSWKAVKGVQGYEIAWGQKGVTDLLDVYKTTTKTSYTVTRLDANTSYAFRIRAYYKSGKSVKYTAWSAKKYVTTGTVIPPVPSITSLAYSNGKVTVKWKTDGRAAGYEVRWGEKGTAGWPGYTDAGKKDSCVASGRIVTGTTMAFQVRAYWWAGSNLWTTSWSDTKYVSTVDKGPELTISGVSVPGTLKKGAGFELKGTISSSEKITSVVGTVYDTKTGKCPSFSTKANPVTVKPNTKSFSIYTSRINTGLKFGELPVGSYRLEIKATTESGYTKVLVSKNFTVEPNTTVSISGAAYPGGTLKKGNGFELKGNITSNEKITGVSAVLYKTSPVLSVKTGPVTISPNSKSVQIYNTKINTGIKFGQLPEGSYRLIIQVTTETGYQKNVVDTSFTVK